MVKVVEVPSSYDIRYVYKLDKKINKFFCHMIGSRDDEFADELLNGISSYMKVDYYERYGNSRKSSLDIIDPTGVTLSPLNSVNWGGFLEYPLYEKGRIKEYSSIWFGHMLTVKDHRLNGLNMIGQFRTTLGQVIYDLYRFECDGNYSIVHLKVDYLIQKIRNYMKKESIGKHELVLR